MFMKKVKKMVGIRTKAEIERDNEMDYRTKKSKARRQIETIRREMERLKLEACDHEKHGEHEKAVSKALQAANKQKMLASANKQLQKCTDLHDMAKTQQTMTDILETCRDLSNGIVDLADMEEALKVQAENEEALARLEDTGEQMEMYAEGITTDLMPEVRNAAGEAALAEIMADQEQAEPIRTELPGIRPEVIRNTQTEEDAAWIQSRREDLRTLAAEA